MIEIRFHGRGGQGAYLASQILALALMKEGKESQSFPRFGGERRGAPTQAFTRISDEQITIASMVYEPDFVVVLDSSLIENENVTQGLKKDGWVIINSNRNPGEFEIAKHHFVLTFDATALAKKYGLGRNVNAIMLGVLSVFAGIGKISYLINAIKEKIPYNQEANIQALMEATKNIRIPQRFSTEGNKDVPQN